MALDRNSLINLLALKKETVTLPEGEVIVSEIGAADYIRLWTDPANQGEDGKADMAKFTPALVARCLVDANGDRLFSDADAEMLGKSAIGPFNALAAAARRLNGLSGEAGNSEPS